MMGWLDFFKAHRNYASGRHRASALQIVPQFPARQSRRFHRCLAELIMFTGTYTAIVTPFKSGAVDETALNRLIQLQIKGGVDGNVPVGTTGESPTVDCEEHINIIASA